MTNDFERNRLFIRSMVENINIKINADQYLLTVSLSMRSYPEQYR